ncbi:MAG TPA: hypothetical protein VES73_09470 [Lamprocystis sp. (in: g-proteobacteria)]|nr:hypothetical protein [Lamprocystis sp. (in: g-proteobacteria)]
MSGWLLDPNPDILIAAPATQHGLTVVTRNTGEFAAAGVAIFIPWKDSFHPGE